MRLIRLDIRGFGRLEGSYPLEPGPRHAGLLLERNEAGKSTLVDAVLAGLYGIESDRRRARDRMVDQDVYRPWEGGAYGLVLHVSVGGVEYSIDRDLERGTARVLSGGKDVSDRFQDGNRLAVGEKLLGISREQFVRSAFVRQGEIVWSDASSLSDALQRMADSTPGETTSASAIAALDDALTSYEGEAIKRGRVETEIQRCQAQLERDREELAKLMEQRRAHGERIVELSRSDKLKVERESKRLAIHRTSIETERMDYAQRLMDDEEARASLAELERLDREEAELLSLDDARVEAAEAAHKQWIGAGRAADDFDKEADRAEKTRKEANAARDALELKRVPMGEDLDALVSARARIEEAANQRERFVEELEHERRDIETRGFALEEATTLLIGFEALSSDDRDLLSAHTRVSVGLDDEVARLEGDRSTWKRMRAEIRSGRQGRKHFGIWLMIVGMLPILIGLSMFGILPFAPMWLHIPGGVAIALGIGVYFSGTRHRLRDDEDAKLRVTGLRRELEELEEKKQEHATAWADLATRLGMESDAMEDRYKALRTVERNVDTVRRLEARVSECDRADEAALASVTEAWKLFDDEPSVDLLAARIDLLKTAFERYHEADAAIANAQALRLRADETKARRNEREGEARSALKSCGVTIPVGETVEKGYELLKDRARRASLARQRHTVEIPKARAELMDDAEHQRLMERCNDLEAEITQLAGEGVGTIELPLGDSASMRREQLRALAEGLQTEEQSEQESREQQLTEVRAFLAHYEATAPRLMESIDIHQNALRRAQQFAQAVGMARDTLAEIASETYRDWAAVLNQSAEELLEGLASDARQIRFDESLGFQILHSGQILTGKEAGQQLSAGALDGVYLAARLAVSRMLSGSGVSLPLVLDDPFANVDDERLLAGLRLIIGNLAPRQQVLLMACQESRYQWALAQLGRPEELVVLPLPGRSEEEAGGHGRFY